MERTHHEREIEPRRFTRSSGLFPVTVQAVEGSRKSVLHGRIVDLSRSGLRIESRRWLIPGQVVNVFPRGSSRLFACCRVVWVRTAGALRPCEAGLEIVSTPPEVDLAHEECGAAVSVVR